MTTEQIISIILKVLISAFASVGFIEWLKNFIKTEKKFIWSIIMPVIAALTYAACEFLPLVVVGAELTIGTVQLNYQILVQGFKKVLDAKLNKITES